MGRKEGRKDSLEVSVIGGKGGTLGRSDGEAENHEAVGEPSE